MKFWDLFYFVTTLTFVQIWLFRIYNLLDKRLPLGKSKEEESK